jgi:hypothetical protein
MAARHRGHGQDGDKIGDAPGIGHIAGGGQHHHAGDAKEGKADRVLELLDHLGHLDEEVGELGLLAGGAPAHVDLEHVGEQRLGDVEGEATEEDGQHEDPLDVLEQGAEEGLLAHAVAHHRQRDVAQPVEDDDDGEPDLPAVDVVLVEVAVEPADGEVVGRGHDPGRADGVVGADVGDDGDLGGEADLREEEAAEERGEGPLVDPLAHRVEEQLVAAVGVLFPAREFVVDGQGDAFLEALARPGGQPDDVAVALEAERHVEVFRHVRLGPEFLVAVFVHVRDLLHRRPTEDGVVADKRGHVAVGHRVLDGGVDQVGEEGDAVFKVVVDDLHDARGKLHDSDIGRLLHFRDRVKEAVGGHTGIGVNWKKLGPASMCIMCIMS